MARKLTLQDAKDEARSQGGECLNESYENARTPMLWRCEKGHEWETSLCNIKSGHWCPTCRREQAKLTTMERYGVENPFQSEECKEKIKNTLIERYGSSSIHKNPEVAEKLRRTNIERYGVPYPAQNRDIALKQAKTLNKQHVRYHWSTGEELVCQGSWEAKVVDYLNANQIYYKWQPESFLLSDSTTYRPDLFLEDDGIWVEIKGWMREDAARKWHLFLQIHPNAQLWDHAFLKKNGIL